MGDDRRHSDDMTADPGTESLPDAVHSPQLNPQAMAAADLARLLSAAGALAMLVYALAGGSNITVVWLLFLPFNMGLGFRGPPGFYRALQASGGDDARASALVILFIMLVTAGGTVLVAPAITDCLAPLALAALLPALFSLVVLWRLPLASDAAGGP